MSSERPASAPTILVTGATGYVGGRLVPCLLREGCHVRCFVRDADRLQSEPWYEDAEVAEGDALNYDTLPPAMADVDVVYYLIHSLGAGEGTFAERDRQAAANVRNAAEAAGVGRIIYLGGMRPKGEHHSKHLQSRIETGDVLREGSVPVTEFRAAQIVGAGSLSFELVRYLTERVPVLICPKWVQTPTQPIAIHDVLKYLVAARTHAAGDDDIIEIGGADVLTYAEMFRIYAGVRGLRRWIVNVPFLTPRLSSHWVGLVTPISNTVARPLIEGLDNEVVVDDPAKARSLFPEIDPISFEAAVRLALRRPDSEDLPTVWNRSKPSPISDGTVSTDKVDGLYREVRSVRVDASPELAFETIAALGGEREWPYGSVLWRLRGWIDRLLGGSGIRRKRPARSHLRVGDTVNFWRVVAVDPGQLLRLRAEMKLPGRAWLQFEISPRTSSTGDTQITQSVYFEPRGLLGAMYWTLARPLHNRVFADLLTGIAERIEERDKDRTDASPAPSPVTDDRNP